MAHLVENALVQKYVVTPPRRIKRTRVRREFRPNDEINSGHKFHKANDLVTIIIFIDEKNYNYYIIGINLKNRK